MPMTQEERDALDAQWLANKPMREWLADMEASDREMPRVLEDVIDVLSSSQKSALAQETKDKYNNKKRRRAKRPV